MSTVCVEPWTIINPVYVQGCASTLLEQQKSLQLIILAFLFAPLLIHLLNFFAGMLLYKAYRAVEVNRLQSQALGQINVNEYGSLPTDDYFYVDAKDCRQVLHSDTW